MPFLKFKIINTFNSQCSKAGNFCNSYLFYLSILKAAVSFFVGIYIIHAKTNVLQPF